MVGLISAGTESWPVSLRREHAGHIIALRPMHPRRDRDAWFAVREQNRDWTGPWDATAPRQERLLDFRGLIRFQNSEAKAGKMLPWVLTVDDQIAGQVHIFGIVRGAQQGGTVGYWIAEAYAGLGIIPLAVAMAMDHAFGVERLHRIEINIRPDNAKSLRVVEKLGMRDEGIRRSFLHIAGKWHDHRTFAITAPEIGPGGMVRRVTEKLPKEKHDTPSVPHSL